MMELPESRTLEKQINSILVGKTVTNVVANSSPHKFAWYKGDPKDYPALLSDRRVIRAESHGGMIEIHLEGIRLIFSDGTNLTYYAEEKDLPKKHQLLLKFDDNTFLVCSIQMYGGLLALKDGETNDYNEIARSKIDPLSDAFDFNYFSSLYAEGESKLSVKEFLATKQRIPGLGNGVLQDILFSAKIHPRRKMGTLSRDEFTTLFESVRNKLKEMTDKGGRDTEKDLYGVAGGYSTILSSKTIDRPCPTCGESIKKEPYMGVNIYYCPNCQKN
ncbi:MAG TPA: endonuclease VIII [Clostridia bacterium]|jgi:formamidopyrimidine-DNA glycosylase|nr:MAG: Formamidopyrimidine-DNA glycosylase [Firmicutes bacterium ADurb.Bin146]HOD93467.1 endonuclease VIII [Clostridia bacterium]HQM39761.1 endonuclease VIII [Clostridia bacterium]